MATRQTGDEAAIREQIDRWAEAIRARDLDRLRLVYAPDIVSFDVGPPMQRVGVDGKLQNWEEAFTLFQPPLDYEIRDLAITVGGDVAFAHAFGRLSGTVNGNRVSGFWVRVTVCFQKIAGSWRIAHDHASVPFVPQSDGAVPNFEP